MGPVLVPRPCFSSSLGSGFFCIPGAPSRLRAHLGAGGFWRLQHGHDFPLRRLQVSQKRLLLPPHLCGRMPALRRPPLHSATPGEAARHCTGKIDIIVDRREKRAATAVSGGPELGSALVRPSPKPHGAGAPSSSAWPAPRRGCSDNSQPGSRTLEHTKEYTNIPTYVHLYVPVKTCCRNIGLCRCPRVALPFFQRAVV